MDSVHHLRARVVLVSPVSVESDWVGYHIYLQHCTSVCWHIDNWLESGPVTVDLTTTVVHSYKLLINVIKPIQSLNGKNERVEKLFVKSY